MYIAIKINAKGNTCEGCKSLDVCHNWCDIFKSEIKRKYLRPEGAEYDKTIFTRLPECVASTIPVECGTCAYYYSPKNYCSRGEWKDGNYVYKCTNKDYKYWKMRKTGQTKRDIDEQA
jgi:hypothetical protein